LEAKFDMADALQTTEASTNDAHSWIDDGAFHYYSSSDNKDEDATSLLEVDVGSCAVAASQEVCRVIARAIGSAKKNPVTDDDAKSFFVECSGSLVMHGPSLFLPGDDRPAVAVSTETVVDGKKLHRLIFLCLVI
jgi:hypothetical protein